MNLVNKVTYSRLSVFDLDHTLLNCNGAHRFAFYLMRQSKMSLRSLLYCLMCYYRHKCFNWPYAKLHDAISRHLFGRWTVRGLQEDLEHFLSQSFEQMCFKPITKILLKAQQEAGHHVVILSNTASFIVELFAKRFGVQEWQGSRYKSNDKGYIGGLEKLFDGDSKAEYVKMLAREHGIKKEKITAYSDSFHDLPLLAVAGRAVAVRPDKKLKAICRERAWEIVV